METVSNRNRHCSKPRLGSDFSLPFWQALKSLSQLKYYEDTSDLVFGSEIAKINSHSHSRIGSKDISNSP
jgi:hypothetical protein